MMDHAMRTPSPTPLERALCSLEGLSVGDAFGECFFVHPDTVDYLIAARALPAPPWRFTDDTRMALSIVAVLRRHGRIPFRRCRSSLSRLPALSEFSVFSHPPLSLLLRNP
jgi:ADP-ribosylglycohydrolase